MKQWTRREVLAVAAAGAVQATVPLRAMAAEQWVYVGTYTTDTQSGGIYCGEWNEQKGEITTLHMAVATDDPTFLLRARIGGAVRIYACNENVQGHVTVFRPEANGTLKEIGKVESGGGGPVHLTVDKTGRTLIVANYAGGSLTAFRLRADGNIGARGSHFQYEGHGPNAKQTGPHTNGVVISPDNRYVLASDLGLDRIFVYRLDPATATLTPSDPPFFASAEGAGPRHTIFHPSGKWAYAVNELNATITQMMWDAVHGKLAEASSVVVMPEGAAIKDYRAGDIQISVDGRFVMTSGRGPVEEIVVYGVDAASGGLTPVQRVAIDEFGARHLCIAPSGRWLLAANQTTNVVRILARDPQSGKLALQQQQAPLESVTCAVFG